MTIRVQERPFDPGKELNRFYAGDSKFGAVASFAGIVRSDTQDPVEKLVIEHYPGMTERAIQAMIDAAGERWQIGDCLVIHRFGALNPGDAIMMVAVRAAHRAAAFEATQFLMDFLKSRAPFWKKEFRGGVAEWVESRAEDEAGLRKWSSG